MYDATLPHIGRNQKAQVRSTKAGASGTAQLRHVDETAKGRRRSAKGQAAVPATVDASHAFLNAVFMSRFLSRAELGKAEHGCTAKQMERDFYRSLSQLAKHYGFSPTNTRQFGYPYNLKLALSEAKSQLENRAAHFDDLALLTDGKHSYLVTEERYDTHGTLYYIPVLPLYHWHRSKRRRPAAELLLSVCAYLYSIVGIPYYRDGESYLFYIYDMLEEWAMEQIEYGEQEEDYGSEWSQAQIIGDIMEQKIRSPHQLDRFHLRLDRFVPRDEKDSECLHIARMAFELYTEYPCESIFRNVGIRSAGDDETIHMENYLSFFASDRGILYQQLIQAVNDHLQEYGYTEEPTVVKKFDGRQHSAGYNLSFEGKVFKLVERLSSFFDSI